MTRQQTIQLALNQGWSVCCVVIIGCEVGDNWGRQRSSQLKYFPRRNRIYSAFRPSPSLRRKTFSKLIVGCHLKKVWARLDRAHTQYWHFKLATLAKCTNKKTAVGRRGARKDNSTWAISIMAKSIAGLQKQIFWYEIMWLSTHITHQTGQRDLKMLAPVAVNGRRPWDPPTY